jgi:hypothetical protein
VVSEPEESEESDEAQEYTQEEKDELSEILRHITKYPFRTRKAERKAEKLATSKATLQFLDAGLSLITEQFSRAERADDGDEEPNPFFAWLSQKRVVNEAKKTKGGKFLTDSQFRDRWRYQPYYIADLLAYSLWVRHRSRHVRNAAESLELLAGSSDFVDVIHEVAYRDLCILFEEPTYRISLIAVALAERDSSIAASIRKTHRVLGESWAALYSATMEARGLRLRPDVTLEELTNMLQALAEGIGMRMISEPNTEVIDHARRKSLLGKAALALVASCVDTVDGRKLEDIVRSMGDSSKGGSNSVT